MKRSGKASPFAGMRVGVIGVPRGTFEKFQKTTHLTGAWRRKDLAMSQQSTVHGSLGEVAVSSLGYDPKLHEAVATSVSLAARGLKPIAQLAANRDHGDRVRYLAGCRCTDCRRANSAYESARQKARAAGDWNGFVLATRRART